MSTFLKIELLGLESFGLSITLFSVKCTTMFQIHALNFKVRFSLSNYIILHSICPALCPAKCSSLPASAYGIWYKKFCYCRSPTGVLFGRSCQLCSCSLSSPRLRAARSYHKVVTAQPDPFSRGCSLYPGSASQLFSPLFLACGACAATSSASCYSLCIRKVYSMPSIYLYYGWVQSRCSTLELNIKFACWVTYDRTASNV